MRKNRTNKNSKNKKYNRGKNFSHSKSTSNKRFYPEKPSIQYMKKLFKRSNLTLKDNEYSQLWEFHKLLRKRNDELDLTRIRRFEDYIIKHYIDCTIIPTMIKLPSPLLDIGTGAGFPGIPLKIVSKSTHIVLGEPRWKRCAFMREVIEKLSLKDIEVYEHKVTGNFPEKMSGVITRAVESVAKTLKRSIDFLELGGQVILMKGPSVQPEINEVAENDFLKKHYELTDDIKYKIHNTPQKRRLVIYTKIKNIV